MSRPFHFPAWMAQGSHASWDRSTPRCLGAVCLGLDWIGLDWIGLVWFVCWFCLFVVFMGGFEWVRVGQGGARGATTRLRCRPTPAPPMRSPPPKENPPNDTRGLRLSSPATRGRGPLKASPRNQPLPPKRPRASAAPPRAGRRARCAPPRGSRRGWPGAGRPWRTPPAGGGGCLGLFGVVWGCLGLFFWDGGGVIEPRSSWEALFFLRRGGGGLGVDSSWPSMEAPSSWDWG